jgi:aryl-phospho-beta-D-glucosidase BglC (GH1 family)
MFANFVPTCRVKILGLSAIVMLCSVIFSSGYASDAAAASCSQISVTQLRGAVFMDPVLSKREAGGMFNAPNNYVGESMRHLNLHGLNVVRVPFYWESFHNNPSAFLNELEVVARAAQANDICVIFDNHHWYTSSHWDIEIAGKSDGRGFPSFAVKSFPTRNNDYEATAGPFWKAFLSNDISVGGKKIWEVQADFFAKVVNRVDRFESVIGYEILNEPHLFSKDQYDDLGNYHTYMAKKIRGITDKMIFFDRETARGFPRDAASEHKIVPTGVPNIVYGPHLYSVPFSGSNAEKQIANFREWAREWGVKVLIGEFSADTQQETDLYLREFKENSFGWTYYAWKPTASRGSGSSLYDTNSTPPTDALKQLVESLDKIYN